MTNCAFTPDQQISSSICNHCTLKNTNLCAHERDIRDILMENALPIQFQPGETIFKQGTYAHGIYILVSGHVKCVQHSAVGDDKIVSLHRPIDLLGIIDVMRNDCYTVTAVAVEEVTSQFVSSQRIFDLVQQQPKIGIKLLGFISDQVVAANERTSILTTKYMRGRVAHTLLALQNEYSVEQEAGWIPSRLKRSDLAAMSNMTTPNMIRILSEFSKNGWIELDKRQIRILDPAALKSTFDQG